MRKLAVSIIASAVASGVFADAKEVEKQLRQRYPATNITAVYATPINGVYEIVMGRNVAYTDESGRYMIFGHLFDMKEQNDLTAKRLEEINRIDVSVLPLSDAIKTVKGNGSRTLYIFSDPDCPFCQRLERETIPKLDNVTIYTFLYPLEGMHPDARRKAEAIWCAKDRAKAWDDFMAKGKVPEGNANCDTPVDRNIRLASHMGINGTPTIITGDGTVVPGFVPAPELERRLSLAQPQTGG